jgi:ParB family chromosome partitioning protein
MPDAVGMSKLANKIVQQSLTVRQAEEEAGLAKAAQPGKKKVRAGSRNDGLDEIAERMGDRLNTRVHITLARTKGTLAIDFATVADLNRILGELGEPGFKA